MSWPTALEHRVEVGRWLDGLFHCIYEGFVHGGGLNPGCADPWVCNSLGYLMSGWFFPSSWERNQG